MRYWRILLVGILLVVGRAPPFARRADGKHCLTDAPAAGHVDFAKELLQGADSTALAAQGFPYSTQEDIALVTPDSVCAEAVAAYNRDTPPENPDSVSQLYVVKLSNNGFMVVDPADIIGEFRGHVIYDKNWVLVIAIAR